MNKHKRSCTSTLHLHNTHWTEIHECVTDAQHEVVRDFWRWSPNYPNGCRPEVDIKSFLLEGEDHLWWCRGCTACSDVPRLVLQWCPVVRRSLMFLNQWSHGMICLPTVPRRLDCCSHTLPARWVCNEDAGLMQPAPSPCFLLLLPVVSCHFHLANISRGVACKVADDPTQPEFGSSVLL
jgi:hypothetical protein